MFSAIEEIGRRAKQASRPVLSADARNHTLNCLATELLNGKDEILAANAEDKKKSAEKLGAHDPLLKRLDVSGSKFDDLIKSVTAVQALPDPLAGTISTTELAEGLFLQKVPAPLGVLCIIYEARPEAGIQIASLAIKSGNTLILKGGSEAHESNLALYSCIKKSLEKAAEKYPEISPDIVQLVETRTEISELLKLNQYIDLVIPRGSNQLVKSVQSQTKIAVLGHADGICSAYVDSSFDDLNLAVQIIVDAKTQYPAACNALETLLVHDSIKVEFLSALAAATETFPVEFKADANCLPLLPGDRTSKATEDDFRTEFLGLKMAVRIVQSIDEAIKHINDHGSHHTDLIISNISENINKFQEQVDSAGVYANASTRFADGYRYGFGAEVGISTSKIHCRGPVGLEGLVLYKYKLTGKGHTVNEMGKTFQYTHKKL